MDALGINLPGLVTQLVSFAILFAVLWMLLYKPISKAMGDRSKKIQDSLEAADKAREEVNSSKEAMEKQIAESRAEGQKMIANAKDIADKFKEEELAKAREEINAEKQRAEADIQRERDAAIDGLRREFASIVVDAAEKIVEKSIDKSQHTDLIDTVVKESAVLRKDK
ncbi:MAG: ATP synthase F0 subunit B [Dehalococcoidia bacterium]|mgnify:FL=1|nr:ATP synthase F0 subunit B [Dehalococcoidia bacterium]MQG16255.1 F0F1 ATP synthase subunit B [SAR202 cluster bacterium]|tara:strand:- start:19477 stop:19980 length:504 start_codon:yes stop_codon:yes gene_type:complete